MRQHHPETRSLTQTPRTQTRRPAYIQRFSSLSKIQLGSKRGRSSPKGFKGGLTLSRDRSKTLSKTLSLKGIGAHEWTTRHSPTRLELSACGLRAGNGADNELSDRARHDPTQHGSRSQLVQRQLGKHRRSTDGSSRASSAINGGSGCRRQHRLSTAVQTESGISAHARFSAAASRRKGVRDEANSAGASRLRAISAQGVKVEGRVTLA